jgi:hypothetical protein
VVDAVTVIEPFPVGFPMVFPVVVPILALPDARLIPYHEAFAEFAQLKFWALQDLEWKQA